jgi:hypothetical protein
VREALMDKRTSTIYPLFRWIAGGGGGGIKVCAVSNFIYTGRFFLEEEGDLFFSMKSDQREKRYFYKICRFFFKI